MEVQQDRRQTVHATSGRGRGPHRPCAFANGLDASRRAPGNESSFSSTRSHLFATSMNARPASITRFAIFLSSIVKPSTASSTRMTTLRAIDRLGRAHDAEVLDALAPCPDAACRRCRRTARARSGHSITVVDRVARRAGLLEHDASAPRPSEPVEQARLARRSVGRPSRTAAPVVVLAYLRGVRAAARRCGRAGRRWPARACRRPRTAPPGRGRWNAAASASSAVGVDLVGDDQHGNAGAAQPTGERAVLLGDARLRVDDEQDEVGLPHRACRLGRARAPRRRWLLQVAGGVDQTEPPAAPGRLELHPVARDARACRARSPLAARTAG